MNQDARKGLVGFDCEEASGRLKRVIASKARGISREDLEDCAGEALVRLVRALRRERPRSLEALQVTIAKRVAFDWIRDQKHRRLHVREDNILDNVPSRDLSNETRHMFWLVREYFCQAAVDCVPLLDARLQGYEWEEVARDVQKTSVGVRQQWTRCCEKARSALMAEGGMIARWLQWAT